MQDHKSQPLTDFIEYPPEEMLERANEFLQTSQRRHSIRSFSNRQVPKEIIETCTSITANSRWRSNVIIKIVANRPKPTMPYKI